MTFMAAGACSVTARTAETSHFSSAAVTRTFVRSRVIVSWTWADFKAPLVPADSPYAFPPATTYQDLTISYRVADAGTANCALPDPTHAVLTFSRPGSCVLQSMNAATGFCSETSLFRTVSIAAAPALPSVPSKPITPSAPGAADGTPQPVDRSSDGPSSPPAATTPTPPRPTPPASTRTGSTSLPPSTSKTVPPAGTTIPEQKASAAGAGVEDTSVLDIAVKKRYDGDKSLLRIDLTLSAHSAAARTEIAVQIYGRTSTGAKLRWITLGRAVLDRSGKVAFKVRAKLDMKLVKAGARVRLVDTQSLAVVSIGEIGLST